MFYICGLSRNKQTNRQTAIVNIMGTVWSWIFFGQSLYSSCITFVTCAVLNYASRSLLTGIL